MGEHATKEDVLSELSSAPRLLVGIVLSSDGARQRRFSRSFQVGLPDRKMRKAVLMKALEDVEVEEGFDWRELAVMTEGYSCGDVVELCREVIRSCSPDTGWLPAASGSSLVRVSVAQSLSTRFSRRLYSL